MEESQKGHQNLSSSVFIVAIVVISLLVGYAYGFSRGKKASGEIDTDVATTEEVTEAEAQTVVEVETYKNPFEDEGTNPFR